MISGKASADLDLMGVLKMRDDPSIGAKGLSSDSLALPVFACGMSLVAQW